MFVEKAPQRMEVTQAEAAGPVENQTPVGPLSMKFTWPITNFNRLYTKKYYYSNKFVVGGCKWRLLIFPNGNKTADYLSLYLDVADSAALPNRWSIHARFGLTVVDQVHGKHSIRKDTLHRFNARDRDWGFASFMPLTDLYDATKGFVVNGKVVVEVDGVVDASSSTGYGRVAPGFGHPLGLIAPSSECNVGAVQAGGRNIGEVENNEAADPVPPEVLNLNQFASIKVESDVSGDVMMTCPQPEHLADKDSCQAIESSIVPAKATNEAIAVPSRTPDLEQLKTRNKNNTPRPKADAAISVRLTEDLENVQEFSFTLPPKSLGHDFRDPFSEVSEVMHLTPQLPSELFRKKQKLRHTLETLTTAGAKGIPRFLQAWEEVCALPYPPNQDGWLKAFSQINSRLSSLCGLYSHSSNQLPALESHCASLRASLANAQKIQSESLALATEERRINDTLSGLREQVYRLQAQITELESRLEVIKGQTALLADPLKGILIEKSRFVCADTMVRDQKKIASSMERKLVEEIQEAVRCFGSYIENPNASPPTSSRFADDLNLDL